MKKIFMSAAMMAFLAASCTNEEIINQPFEGVGVPFTLSAEHGMASRTTLSGNQTLWSEGDQIYVSSADGSVYGWLTLKAGANSDNAEFFGYVNGDISKLAYTIFPAPKSGNVIDLSNRDASNSELDAPMIATFNPSNMNSVEFKNETALIKQTISGLNGQTVTLSGNGIGGQLKPMLINGQWELVSIGGSADEISITGATDGTLLIPIATSANQEEKAENQVIKEGITLTCTISEPNGGTSVSTTYSVDVENGKATETNVPTFEYEESHPVEDTKDILLGGNITLSENLALTSPLIITQTTTLDLAGHSITNAGTLTAANNATSVDALIVVRPGATLTINDSKGGGSITTDDILCGIKLTDKNDEANSNNDWASLIVNGGTIQGKTYGISGNGNQNRNKTELTINGGSIISLEGPAVYQPQNGTTTVTGGVLNGAASAFEIRAGKLAINGGTFTSTVAAFTKNASGNGFTMIGTALAISQHKTDLGIAVNINGGTFNGKYALYEESIDSNSTKVELNVNGGIFNGPIYSENCNKFISACTFTEGSVLNYLAKESNLQMDRNVTLTGGTNDYGNEDTKVITISGNNNTLTFVDSYRTYISNAGGKFVFNDVVINRETTSNKTHWHDNNMKFECEVEMNNVTFNKGITLESKATLNNVTINKNTVDTYAIFICVGADVTMTNGCKIITAADKGRGIKVTNEDVKDKTAETKISISNTSFETSKKAAITVESQSKTVITLGEKVDISKVKADQINAVWVDKDAADYYNLVEVTGGSKKQEE